MITAAERPTGNALPDQLPGEVPRMTLHEMKSFTSDLAEGRLFTNLHIDPKHQNMLGHIFGPLGMGLLSQASENYLQSMGIVWAPLRDAQYGAVNGYPSFPNCHVMHKDDWEQCQAAYLKLSTAKDISIDEAFE